VISPARVAAFEILSAVSASRADLPGAIAALRSGLRDDRDRALAADIATGVQRMRAALDHLIAAFAKRPVERLDPEIVEILRLSAYQLLHHSRVPASAVVDDAVDLAKRAGKRSATGFVNAVLRAISRQRGSLPLPGRPDDPADRDAALDYLSVTLSHPRWLAARWYDRYGFDATEAWLGFDNLPAPLTLRANRLRLPREELPARLAEHGVVVRPARFAPDGFIVERGHALAGPGRDDGWFVVQDEASQIVALLAGDYPGSRLLDTCASPGGKTTALAAAMRNEGLLVACDVRPRRMDLLRRTVAASGAARVRLVRADLLAPLPFPPVFDCVLVDAPCSGLGTLRRDPDIRWRRRESELPALAAAQLRMLRHAADTVAPGGRLVYATCSSEPEENDAVVDAFLAAAPAFAAVDARDVLPPAAKALVDERGRLRTLPHLHGLEAFFGAVLRHTVPIPGS
jgi:16S rRNA (cytosine967-C5)-methyltransferase